jgi:hypothetical protein
MRGGSPVAALLLMSLTTGLLALPLALLSGRLGKRYAPKWRVWAWLALSLRLLIPVTAAAPRAPIQIPTPALRVEGPLPAEAAPREAARPGPGVPAEKPAAAASPERAPGRPALTGAEWAGALWLLGAVCLAAYHILGYRLFRRRVFRWSVPADKAGVVGAVYAQLTQEMGIQNPPRLYISHRAEGPLLTGLLRPIIVLPRGADDSGAKALRRRMEILLAGEKKAGVVPFCAFLLLVGLMGTLVACQPAAARGSAKTPTVDEVMVNTDDMSADTAPPAPSTSSTPASPAREERSEFPRKLSSLDEDLVKETARRDIEAFFDTDLEGIPVYIDDMDEFVSEGTPQRMVSFFEERSVRANDGAIDVDTVLYRAVIETETQTITELSSLVGWAKTTADTARSGDYIAAAAAIAQDKLSLSPDSTKAACSNSFSPGSGVIWCLTATSGATACRMSFIAAVARTFYSPTPCAAPSPAPLPTASSRPPKRTG